MSIALTDWLYTSLWLSTVTAVNSIVNVVTSDLFTYSVKFTVFSTVDVKTSYSFSSNTAFPDKILYL